MTKISHRDYWVVKFEDDDMLLVSRDSETGLTLASLATMDPFVPPREVEFDPDDIVVGSVLAADNGRTRTVTEVKKMPRLSITTGA